jgi:hypothetical protein
VLILLMQAHREFQVVTPRTLAGFRGRTLVLPDVHVLDDRERTWLSSFAADHRLVVTGVNATGLSESSKVVRFSDCPGKAYLAALEKDFVGTYPETQAKFLQVLGQSDQVLVSASPWLATSIAQTEGKLTVFIASFGDLRPGANAVQTPESGAFVTVRGRGKGFFLPFLGAVQEITGEWDGAKTKYKLPPVNKGGVAWIEGAN